MRFYANFPKSLFPNTQIFQPQNAMQTNMAITLRENCRKELKEVHKKKNCKAQFPPQTLTSFSSRNKSCYILLYFYVDHSA